MKAAIAARATAGLNPVRCAALSASVLIAAVSAARAETATFADFPMVIYCEESGITHAFYFSRLGQDGVAVYLTPDQMAGVITIDGTARRVGGEKPGNCAGKTLEELREQGQSFQPAG
jgi:hypothetical protein